MKSKEYINICDIDLKRCYVCVTDFKKPCKYHNKKGGIYNRKGLSPDGMCPHLFHKAYPYALALLYGARFKGAEENATIAVTCPALEDPISIEVYRIRQDGVTERIKNFLKELLVLLNLHCNPLYYRVYMKVIKASWGCRYNHREADVFEFNIGDSAEVCPAAFDAVFPQLVKQEGSLSIVCPDHLGKVSFRTGRYDDN